jgi:deoxyribodipyrimidine photolyase-related protein
VTTTVWILGDQLHPRISALAGLDPSACVVLMIESLARARQLPYHKQKLAFLWSAMRHFADELRHLGYTVDYYPAQPNFTTGLRAHLDRHQPTTVRLMQSAEHGGSARLAELVVRQGVTAEITPNRMFLSDRAEFARMARGRQALSFDNFYRRMRRKTGLLMNEAAPEGGEWSADRLSRERPPAGHAFPPIPRFTPDAITADVIALVAREFPSHFGTLDGFGWPVTRADADRFLEDFLDHRLDLFGPYQDAIAVGQGALYHSLLAPLLNAGLLEPLDACRRAEARYRAGQARLGSVEGFIRQIIGWREFVYQVYHLKMPGYLALNYFGADLPLPRFYWTGDTRMACIADAVRSVQQHGINHHAQRLMVTGNFALIAGLDPQAVDAWYRLAYVDAYEWAVAPNVLGLALYADGGLVAAKPTAASANYIQRMSDCCEGCAYDPRQTLGERACPFNALYWDFLARNRAKLKDNPRMNMILAMHDTRDKEMMREIRAKAAALRDKLRKGDPV